MRRCVFFDRDGIVNVPPKTHYIERWSEFSFQPGFIDVLRAVHDRGFDAVVITNQSAVARGVMTLDDVEDIHTRMRRELAATYGLDLLDVVVCPHDDGECRCRKPQPGMLLDAARRHGIDLQASWMIGDQERDVEAGRGAGCRTILVSGDVSDSAADYVVCDMGALQTLIAKVLPVA